MFNFDIPGAYTHWLFTVGDAAAAAAVPRGRDRGEGCARARRGDAQERDPLPQEPGRVRAAGEDDDRRVAGVRAEPAPARHQ